MNTSFLFTRGEPVLKKCLSQWDVRFVREGLESAVDVASQLLYQSDLEGDLKCPPSRVALALENVHRLAMLHLAPIETTDEMCALLCVWCLALRSARAWARTNPEKNKKRASALRMVFLRLVRAADCIESRVHLIIKEECVLMQQ
jgi:hypothetical protein